MNRSLKGHQFASDTALKDLYDSTLLPIALFAEQSDMMPNDPNVYFAAGFNEAGLREIAAEHVAALQLSKGLYIDLDPDADVGINYRWLCDAKAPFTEVSMSVNPSRGGWASFVHRESRTRQPDLGIDPTDPKRFDDLGEDTAQILIDRIQNSRLDFQMGSFKVLEYQAAAMTGIMKAIAHADPAQVRAMLCDPSSISQGLSND